MSRVSSSYSPERDDVMRGLTPIEVQMLALVVHDRGHVFASMDEQCAVERLAARCLITIGVSTDTQLIGVKATPIGKLLFAIHSTT